MVSTGTGGATAGPLVPPAPVLVPTPRLARLSHAQWAASVRDLLRLADVSDIVNAVSGDAVVGFDNDAASLYVGVQLRADLEQAAVALAARATADAAALARLLPANAPTDLAGKARAFDHRLSGLRAYRRPLADAEVSEHVTLFNKGPDALPSDGRVRRPAANLVLQALLQSPHFLYRTELGTQVVNGRIPLSDYEIAAKLSLALTNTLPDDALLAAAAAGELHSAAVGVRPCRPAARDARRAPPAAITCTSRCTAWARTTASRATPPCSRSSPPAAPAAMRQEVLLFLRWVFDEGYGVKRDVHVAGDVRQLGAGARCIGLSGSFGNGVHEGRSLSRPRSGAAS